MATGGALPLGGGHAIHKWCIRELHTWNLYNLISQFTAIKLLKEENHMKAHDNQIAGNQLFREMPKRQGWRDYMYSTNNTNNSRFLVRRYASQNAMKQHFLEGT